MIKFREIEVFDIRTTFERLSSGQQDEFVFDSLSFGLSTPWKVGSLVRRKINLPVILEGLDSIGEYRRFMDRHRGPQLSFWVPAYLNDFPVVSDESASSTTMTVEGNTLTEKWSVSKQFRFIALLTRSGKMEFYGVTGVAQDGVNEILTLDRGLETDLVASETICCPLIVSRLEEDEVPLTYLSGAVARSELQVLEAPQEYPDETFGSSALDFRPSSIRPAFLYRLTDGVTTLRLADYGVEVTAGELTWDAADVGGSELVSTLDMLGDQMTLTIRTADPDHPLLAYQDPLNMKNWTVEVWFANLDLLEVFDLTSPDHIGRVERVEFPEQGAIELQVSSLFRTNENSIPTLKVQRLCNNRTGQGICGVNLADFTTTTTVDAISSSPPYIEAAAFGTKATAESDPNWFALGRVTIGSEVRLCTGQDGDRLYLNYPFREASVNDSVDAIAGDDKRIGTCIGKFNRLEDHMGFHLLPDQNPSFSALETPKAKGGKKS